MNPQHGGQGIRRTDTYAAGLWIVRLDQIDKCLPKHHLIHLGQKFLLLGAPFGGCLLVISKPKLLAAVTSVLALIYTPILAQSTWVFQGLPKLSRLH